MSIEAVLADQCAVVRALLMTFYVTQRGAEDRGSPGQTGWGSAGSALRPGPARFHAARLRQFVVVAAGLSWAAVLAVVVGNLGRGQGGGELGGCFCIVAGGARARWSRSANQLWSPQADPPQDDDGVSNRVEAPAAGGTVTGARHAETQRVRTPKRNGVTRRASDCLTSSARRDAECRIAAGLFVAGMRDTPRTEGSRS